MDFALFNGTKLVRLVLASLETEFYVLFQGS
ncbi:hypothetical protein SAMN04515695_4468 [Pseudovibrio sp. Tun.PSC04-5.I4]|nr:hypothetical protein SAMN04515695_4468 [Pseudovibrio sp. Tun.PSC04-5.I4]